MAELLKNQFFQRSFIEQLGLAIRAHYPEWDQDLFLRLVYDPEWNSRELKQRMSHISVCLQRCLPTGYSTAVDTLVQVVPLFSGFNAMVFSDYVGQYGLDDFDTSMKALEVFTQAGSGEFAIRPFINRYREETMARMLTWSVHPNCHVRRLASEGCRPRLPWAMAIPGFKKDPSPIFPVLENLKDDPELYVRKSVANNLNDISKDHPDLVLDRLSEWNKDATENTRWIIRHALRGLVKAGNSRALSLLGFERADVSVGGLTVSPASVSMGERISIRFELANNTGKAQRIMVDYIVHFMKANGSLRPKVFKLRSLLLEANQHHVVEKFHSFVSITTRKYYPGAHKVSIQVNGMVFAEESFYLSIDDG